MTTNDAAATLAGGTIDHSGFAAVTATAASQHAEHGVATGSAANPGQSQRNLHTTSETGPAAAEQHAARDATPKSAANPGQSQRDSHTTSETGPAATEQHAAHDATPGQSQRDLHAASKDASAATEQHAANDTTPGSGASHGQSQRDLHAASANPSNNSHSGSNPNAASKDQPAPADAGHAKMTAAPVRGDSFQFKSEIAASKHDTAADKHDTAADVGNGQASTAHGRHVAGHDELAAIQDAEPAGLSPAEQNADDHARVAQHHVPHDLIV
jgi:hypothetical protein